MEMAVFEDVEATAMLMMTVRIFIISWGSSLTDLRTNNYVRNLFCGISFRQISSKTSQQRIDAALCFVGQHGRRWT